MSIAHRFVALGIAHHHIAALGKQGLADEAGGLREPSVLDGHLELRSHDLGNLVLEALTLVVREWHVGRVGADAQRQAVDEVNALPLGWT